MNYRSVANLNEQILDWTRRLPRDLELIVGVPRSGLLAANLLALHLNLPLSDIHGFAAGRVLMAGVRCQAVGEDYLDRPRKVLVVDDSVLYGTQMAQARRLIRHQIERHDVRFAAVYVQPGKEGLLDYHCEALSRPRVFEWHLMHHPNLRHWCVDIDGVLCADPSVADNDDGENYRRFIADAEPLIVPSKEIGWLVTCRLEKYREPTEAWLRRQRIDYRHLIMMDHPDAASRRAAGDYARFKAAVYRRTGAHLFIESSPAQAIEIARRSGRSVFCFETREMINPGLLLQALRQPQTVFRNLFRAQSIRLKKFSGLAEKG